MLALQNIIAIFYDVYHYARKSLINLNIIMSWRDDKVNFQCYFPFVTGFPDWLWWTHRLLTWHAKGVGHYDDVTMTLMASQITSLTIVYSTVYSGADQRKHQSSASLVFVRGIHRGPVNSPHKWPVTRKMFPFDDVIMTYVEVNQVQQLWWKSLWWRYITAITS